MKIKARRSRLNPDTKSSDVTVVFGGIWKECYKAGPSIRLLGGVRARLSDTREPSKNPKGVSVVGSGPIPAVDQGEASLSLECDLRLEQILSFQRLAIISKSNISGRTINGVF